MEIILFSICCWGTGKVEAKGVERCGGLNVVLQKGMPSAACEGDLVWRKVCANEIKLRISRFDHPRFRLDLNQRET